MYRGLRLSLSAFFSFFFCSYYLCAPFELRRLYFINVVGRNGTEINLDVICNASEDANGAVAYVHDSRK